MKIEIALRQALGKPAYAWFMLKLKYPLVFAAKLNCLAGATLAVLAAGTLFQTGIWPAFVLAAMWIGSHLIAPNLIMTAPPDDRQLPKRLGLLTLGFYVLALTGAALYSMRVPEGWRILLGAAAAAPPLCAVAARLLQFFLLVRKPEAAKGFGLFVGLVALGSASALLFGTNAGVTATGILLILFAIPYSVAAYGSWRKTENPLSVRAAFSYSVINAALCAIAAILPIATFSALATIGKSDSPTSLTPYLVIALYWWVVAYFMQFWPMDAARRMASAPAA